MKICMEKDLRVLIFALLSALMLMVSLPRAESVWSGVKTVYGRQDFGLRILRKAMLVGVASQHGTQDFFGLDGRIAGGRRLVWKISEPLIFECRENHGKG
ncbi:MAG: hypothetical protein PHY54_07045 [Methylococcales bacterium]|nr:hypothetical protein [Methylococcales bacterium]